MHPHCFCNEVIAQNACWGLYIGQDISAYLLHKEQPFLSGSEMTAFSYPCTPHEDKEAVVSICKLHKGAAVHVIRMTFLPWIAALYRVVNYSTTRECNQQIVNNPGVYSLSLQFKTIPVTDLQKNNWKKLFKWMCECSGAIVKKLLILRETTENVHKSNSINLL